MVMSPPPLRKQPPAQPAAPAADRFSVARGRLGGPQRIVIYGPGGVGKSTLAALAPNPVFIDIEEGTRELDGARVNGVNTWADIRACLQSSALDAYKTVVLDSGTKAEELAIAHTLKTVKHEKGYEVTSIEGYGFGKGLQHVYDTFLHLLSDFDAQIRRGRNVILICHVCTDNVPNPRGDDYIRYEPHLQHPKSGKASIRNRVVQWADHVLFLGYDVISEDGKGKGAGTRTVWTFELPTHIAKSRIVREAIPFHSPTDGAIWRTIFPHGGA